MTDRTFAVDPHKGAGPIRFGMTRSEVEAAMGSTPKRAKRNRLSIAEYDKFTDDGLFVYYDPDDRALAVEFFEMGKVSYPPDVALDQPFDQLLAWVRKMDPGVVVETGDYFRSDALGIAGGPRSDPSENAVESVIVYRPNYYEDDERWARERSASS